jgi:hypothetical protein
MTEKKQSFLLYNSYYSKIKKLSTLQNGKLLDLIFLHSLEEEFTIDDPIIEMAFSFIMEDMNINYKKWEDIKQKRADAGKQGGRGNSKAKKANALSGKQNKAKQSKKSNTKHSVNVICNMLYVNDICKMVYETDNETISWFKIDEDKFQYMKKEIATSYGNYDLVIEDVFDEVLSLTQNNVIGNVVYSQQITCLIILYALRRRYPTKEKKSCTPIDTPTKFENLKSDLDSCAKGNIVKSLTNAISNCWNSVPLINDIKTFTNSTSKDDKWKRTNDNDYSGEF